ncbi:hypothetical protein G5714_012777 [Onychostoma macrolepis]|uniref:Uncharacterized protein n=1 Tax=Onychostoma macrolepis TaxID=369639 RepID=A0A7J6CHJ1_9TELE|nr:hypothetical protein G5714_012777 [Onychostoma macrolepis]
MAEEMEESSGTHLTTETDDLAGEESTSSRNRRSSSFSDEDHQEEAEERSSSSVEDTQQRGFPVAIQPMKSESESKYPKEQISARVFANVTPKKQQSSGSFSAPLFGCKRFGLIWFLLRSRQQSSRQCPAPHEELTKTWRASYSARVNSSIAVALTTVDNAGDKGHGEDGFP